MAASAVAVVVGMASYVLMPMAAYGAGGYPGPDVLPGVPTYGGLLGNIPVGSQSHLTWVCGFDAPNTTNHSPRDAPIFIKGHLAAYLPISTQNGCVSFTVSVSLANAKHQIAPCGYAYVSVNGGPFILVKDGKNSLIVTGIKHYHHVGAILPFNIPTPASTIDYCPHVTTTTRPGHHGGGTIPTSTTPTTIHNETTTTGLHTTSTTMPGFNTTSSVYDARPTATVPHSLNGSPTTTLKKMKQVITLLAVVVAAGAAATSAGGFFAGVPESLVEEYTSEIAPGGGLPFQFFPVGGVGTLALLDNEPALGSIGAAWSTVPAGGGYPFGSSVPNGTVSSGYSGPPVARTELDDKHGLFIVQTPDTPSGGGSTMSNLSPRTGGSEASGGSASGASA
jgi:hypothetical protein